MSKFAIGDVVQGIDAHIHLGSVRGTIIELDDHPIGDSYAKVQVDSPALPPPQVWVNLRLFRRAEGL